MESGHSWKHSKSQQTHQISILKLSLSTLFTSLYKHRRARIWCQSNVFSMADEETTLTKRTPRSKPGPRFAPCNWYWSGIMDWWSDRRCRMDHYSRTCLFLWARGLPQSPNWLSGKAPVNQKQTPNNSVLNETFQFPRITSRMDAMSRSWACLLSPKWKASLKWSINIVCSSRSASQPIMCRIEYKIST